MRIDGRNGYARTERLKPGETTLKPESVADKRRIRGLACDTVAVPPKQRQTRV